MGKYPLEKKKQTHFGIKNKSQNEAGCATNLLLKLDVFLRGRESAEKEKAEV